jgi:DNA-binding CsgD family transcriptional regulator
MVLARAVHDIARMTRREREALHLVGRGLTTPQIAHRTGVGRGTVDQVLESATRKLGAASRMQAAAIFAERAGGGEGDHTRHIRSNAPVATIDADGTGLLALLAKGRSLSEAAAALYLSRRTADRRLAAARIVLGVATTVEALLAFQEYLGSI